MKPVLVFQTGIESLSQPLDIVSGVSYVPKRVTSAIIDTVTITPNSDDELSLSESGYDKFIATKGINSTLASVLAIVPLRKESAEESVITVQRGLNKAVLTTATEIVNSLTGSFTAAQTTDFNSGYTTEFNNAVDNIIAAYRAKVSYLDFIDDFYNLQSTDATSWMLINPEIVGQDPAGPSNTTKTSIDFSVKNLSGFLQASSTSAWATDILSVTDTDSRLNITKMAQLARNCYGVLKYAGITTKASQDNTFTIESVSNDVYDQSIEMLGSIYDNSYNLNSTMLEQVADCIFTTLSKDISLQYSSGFSDPGADVKTVFRTALGGLSDLGNEQDLSSNKNCGAFSEILSLTNEGLFVLSLDNASQSQSFLSDYVVADQYYLIDPLANNPSFLDTRSQQFQQIYQNIYNNLDSLRKKMILNNDTTMFFEFLNCISAYIDRSFMTEIPVSIVDREASALRFTLIMKSADDPALMNVLFKIAGLRDRMRNSEDYEQDSTKVGAFKAKALAGIKTQEARLASLLGLTGYPALSSGDDIIEKTLSLLDLKIPSIANLVTPGADQQDSIKTDSMSDLWKPSVLDPFLTDDANQLDLFYEFAKNLEKSSTLTSAGMTNDNPFTAKVGIISQFIESNRDHRAFSFFLKTIYWFRGLINDNGDSIFQLTSYQDNFTEVSSSGGGDASSRTYDKIYYSLYYDYKFFANIKGIINKVLSLTNILTTTDTAQPSDISGYENQIKTTVVTTSSSIDDIALAAELLDIQTEEIISATFDGEYLTVSRVATQDTKDVYESNVKILVDSLLAPTMYKTQVVYDTFSYILDYITKTNSLLSTAATAAKNYIPAYNENLASLYTRNSVTWLERCRQNGLKTSDFSHYTSDYYRTSSYLLGMLNYADTVLPTAEDSFIVVCGIPYGMLERLGAFKLNVEKDVNITLTFRDVNYGTATKFERTYKFPAVSFVDQATQQYTTNSIGSQEDLVNSTTLKFLDQNGNIATDNFTDVEVKTQEIQSNSILEYMRLLYGLDFDINAFHQNQDVDVTSAYPNLASIKTIFDNYVAGLKINPLVKSRYTRTVDNIVELQKQKIMKEALQGFVFDKIIAIPISGSDLSGSSDFYLCDLIISVELVTSAINTATETTTSTITSASQTARRSERSEPSSSRSREISEIVRKTGFTK